MHEVIQGLIEVLPPGDLREDDIPVLLRPPWLLRPFEMLVSAYGLPKYHDLASTLFVAISFVLMFGMMFGDVGHGAVLVVGGLVALLKSRVPRIRDLGILLVFNGLSSALFGVVYGSYFGIPSWHKYALWGHPEIPSSRRTSRPSPTSPVPSKNASASLSPSSR